MGELRSAVDALAAVDPDELESDVLSGLVAEVLAQTDRLAAIGQRLIAAHDRRKVWQREGAHSEKQWLTQRCRLTPGEAGARAAAARHLDLLPETAEAAVAGEIGAGQARVAANAVRDLPRAALDGLDKLVAEQGPNGDAGRLRAAVDEFAHRTAPESLEARERRAYERRRLSITKTGDGGAVLDGYLDVLGAETVITALAPLAAPAGADDQRRPEQRRADALVDLARRSFGGRARAGVQQQPEGGDRGAGAERPPEGGDRGAGAERPPEGADPGAGRESGARRPQVTVVIDLDALLKQQGAPPAVLDRLGALSGEAARLLACDARISRVITDGASQVLDVGRTTRTVTAAQRRALTVRDKGCVGCRAPAGWCEGHHIRFWSEGGKTDLSNLVLLCHRCHRDVHHRKARPAQGPDGTWTLKRRE